MRETRLRRQRRPAAARLPEHAVSPPTNTVPAAIKNSPAPIQELITEIARLTTGIWEGAQWWEETGFGLSAAAREQFRTKRNSEPDFIYAGWPATLDEARVELPQFYEIRLDWAALQNPEHPLNQMLHPRIRMILAGETVASDTLNDVVSDLRVETTLLENTFGQVQSHLLQLKQGPRPQYRSAGYLDPEPLSEKDLERDFYRTFETLGREINAGLDEITSVRAEAGWSRSPWNTLTQRAAHRLFAIGGARFDPRRSDNQRALAARKRHPAGRFDSSLTATNEHPLEIGGAEFRLPLSVRASDAINGETGVLAQVGGVGNWLTSLPRRHPVLVVAPALAGVVAGGAVGVEAGLGAIAKSEGIKATTVVGEPESLGGVQIIAKNGTVTARGFLGTERHIEICAGGGCTQQIEPVPMEVSALRLTIDGKPVGRTVHGPEIYAYDIDAETSPAECPPRRSRVVGEVILDGQSQPIRVTWISDGLCGNTPPSQKHENAGGPSDLSAITALATAAKPGPSFDL